MTQNIIEPQTPKESAVISLNVQPGYNMEKYFPKAQPATTTTGAQGQGGAANALQEKPKPIVDAGTIAYAQILTEANSDIPGPVLAEVASGPLAGGRAIGQFSVAERRLVITFTRIVKDGVEYSTSAYALDPATTLPGMATSVDDHYFRRVFLPAAAKFIEGYADAVTQTNNQVVVTNGTVVSNTTTDLSPKQELLQGVNEGAQKLSDIIDNDADRPITVKIHAGTRIGLLFVQGVLDPNAASQQQQQQPTSLGQAVFNATPAGQVYNAYNAYNGQQQATTTQQQAAAPGSLAAFQQQQQAINSNLGMNRR
jgi:intracellular multiplication protein IcmE